MNRDSLESVAVCVCVSADRVRQRDTGITRVILKSITSLPRANAREHSSTNIDKLKSISLPCARHHGGAIRI